MSAVAQRATAAARDGDLAALRALVAAHPGAVRAVDDTFGKMALHEASCRDVAEFLVQHGAPLDPTEREGWTPLHFAAWCGDIGVVECLAQHGASLEAATTADGWTPLYLGAWRGRVDVVECLAQHGARLEAADDSGVTPLYRASWEGNFGVVECLVQLGAVVDAAEMDGWTPLYHAAFFSHTDITLFLVRSGASLDVHPPGDNMSLRDLITDRGMEVEVMHARRERDERRRWALASQRNCARVQLWPWP